MALTMCVEGLKSSWNSLQEFKLRPSFSRCLLNSPAGDSSGRPWWGPARSSPPPTVRKLEPQQREPARLWGRRWLFTHVLVYRWSWQKGCYTKLWFAKNDNNFHLGCSVVSWGSARVCQSVGKRFAKCPIRLFWSVFQSDVCFLAAMHTQKGPICFSELIQQ